MKRNRKDSLETPPVEQGELAPDTLEGSSTTSSELAVEREPQPEELPARPGAAHAGEAEPESDEHEATDISWAHLRGLLEALIFASDRPLKTGELARLASARLRQVRELMDELRAEYADRGIVLDEVAGGWLFRTSARYAPFVRDLAGEKPVKLSRAQIETLAIAAYRQPITRPEIDEIRGVDSAATLKLLLERDLLRILGKKDEPGRPMLYGTTTHFLEFFGLKSLKDLPTLKEFTELSEESRLVAEEELGEELPGAAPEPLGTESQAPVSEEHGASSDATAASAGPHESTDPPSLELESWTDSVPSLLTRSPDPGSGRRAR